MKIDFSSKSVVKLLTIASLCLGSAVAFAADAPATTPPPPPAHTHAAPPTKEMREKMAVIHDQAATCLRSDKTMSDCRKEMMKSCHDAGPRVCGMMEGHHKMWHHDANHEHAADAQPAAAPATTP